MFLQQQQRRLGRDLTHAFVPLGGPHCTRPKECGDFFSHQSTNALRDRDISLEQFKRLLKTLVCVRLRRIVTGAFLRRV